MIHILNRNKIAIFAQRDFKISNSVHPPPRLSPPLLQNRPAPLPVHIDQLHLLSLCLALDDVVDEAVVKADLGHVLSRRPVDELFDPRPEDGGEAHGTGLRGRVYLAVGEVVSAQDR